MTGILPAHPRLFAKRLRFGMGAGGSTDVGKIVSAAFDAHSKLLIAARPQQGVAQ